MRERERERGVGAQTDRFISTADSKAHAFQKVLHSFLEVREGLREERSLKTQRKWINKADNMDALALEATQPKKAQNGAMLAAPGLPTPAKRKPAKKTKKAVVFFEVEILDAKTKDKLCFLDKVGKTLGCIWISDVLYALPHLKPF